MKIDPYSVCVKQVLMLGVVIILVIFLVLALLLIGVLIGLHLCICSA